MRLYICSHAYMYINTCIYIYICTHIVYTCIHLHTYIVCVCPHVWMYDTHTHTHTHTCFPLRAIRMVQEEPMGEAVRSTSITVVSVHTHTHTHKHTHTHVHHCSVCTHTLSLTHTRTHAHTHVHHCSVCIHAHTRTHTLYMHYINTRKYTCHWRTVNRQNLITNRQLP